MQLPLAPFQAFSSVTPHIKKFYSSSTPSAGYIFSFVQSLSLSSSEAMPSSCIRRLSEQAGSAPLLCVLPHLRDLCCILFCVLPAHVLITGPVLGLEIHPGQVIHISVWLAQFPQLKNQDIKNQLWEETEGNCGAAHDMAYKPSAASTTALFSPNKGFFPSIFCLEHQFNLISAYEQKQFSPQEQFSP